jgi:5-methyltetrahydrofolate--homocysteine methyltransferase
LRQQLEKGSSGQPNFSAVRFHCTEGLPARIDYLRGVQCNGRHRNRWIHAKEFEAAHDDYNKILLKALADRLAEAFAELHSRKKCERICGVMRKSEKLSNEDLIKEKYSGIRPAPGYPALSGSYGKMGKLFELLGGETATGIHLTESLAMYPASSVCGWYFAHPQSQYFGVGKIQKDQLDDYAQRKGMSLDEATKWLRPILE